MTQNLQLQILLMTHLVLIAFYLGGQFLTLAVTLPASYKFFNTNNQVKFLQNIYKLQSPILLFVLCLVVLSGGFMITPIKSQLGADYFAAFGSRLIIKLGFFFIVFLVSAYQALAVGFRLKALDPAVCADNQASELGAVRTQLAVTSVINIIITIVVMYFGKRL